MKTELENELKTIKETALKAIGGVLDDWYESAQDREKDLAKLEKEIAIIDYKIALAKYTLNIMKGEAK